MNKFTNIITESKSPDDQLQMGIKIESKKEFYKKIAEAHLKEMSDYYTRLKKIESD
jgi:hypothetical protein